MKTKLSLVIATLLLPALTPGLGGAGGMSLQAAPPSRVLPEMMTPDAAKAIERGMRYLAGAGSGASGSGTQRADGSWLNSGSYGSYPAVMTSLAGLALMSGGSTPETGQYSREVRKAMMYVLKLGETDPDGLISGPGGEGRSMYGHGFSMLFLAQCYGMDLNKDISERVRKLLDKAVLLTAKSQSDLGPVNKNAGGWIYTPTQNSDEGSVTVTQLQALRACRNVGIKVPLSTINRAVLYLKHCQNADGGISYSASSRGGSRPPISAAAIACFYAAGTYDRQAGGAGPEAEMVDKLVAYCKRNMDINRGDGHYFYSQFYYAQALYQRGGQDWKDYYPKMRDRLLSMQKPDGSWQGDGVGSVYGTAIALVILQLPYGYLPIFQR